MPRPLTAAELGRWTAWKRATDAVAAAVAREIQAATGLSAADFSVLTRIVEIGHGALRQQELADLLGWERSRLSRQITRMTERGLVTRTVDGATRTVAVTAGGRELVARARPAHAAAVRAALLSAVPAADAERFWAAVDLLSGRPGAGGDAGARH